MAIMVSETAARKIYVHRQGRNHDSKVICRLTWNQAEQSSKGALDEDRCASRTLCDDFEHPLIPRGDTAVRMNDSASTRNTSASRKVQASRQMWVLALLLFNRGTYNMDLLLVEYFEHLHTRGLMLYVRGAANKSAKVV